MTKNLELNMEALQALHRFGDILEEAIHAINSDTIEAEAIRTAKDGVGTHWYGMRCGVSCKESGNYFYLHIGLIFYPDTRTGLMVELDLNSNPSVYKLVRKNIQNSPDYEINQEEEEYLKLFMPDDVFAGMETMEKSAQTACLARYIESAAQAIIKAAKGQGFFLKYEDLHHVRELGAACKEIINHMESGICIARINEEERDNFGDYASGYRYYLTDMEDTVSFYAYFGVIYSYKKRPCGMFAEIDWLNNKDIFHFVFENIDQASIYDVSKAEPKFLKLFLKTDVLKKFHRADRSLQDNILKKFFCECNEQMIRAYKKGKSNER